MNLFMVPYFKKMFPASVFILFFFCTGIVLSEADTPSGPATPSSEPASIATPQTTLQPTPRPGLKGKFGLGTAQSIDSTVLLSARYWFSDQVAMDVLAGGYVGARQGKDFSGNDVDDPYWNYVYGVGFKYNCAQPLDGLRIQVLNRFLYQESWSQRSSDPYLTTDKYQYFIAHLGLGFEYFIPFVKNLSLEAGEYLEFNETWRTTHQEQEYGSTTDVSSNTWQIKTAGSGFTITALSIHYYF